MKNVKKLTALLLAIILVMGLFAGCGKKEEEEGDEFVYVANYVDVPFEIDNLGNSAVIGDRLYITARVVVDTITHTETAETAEPEFYPAIGSDVVTDIAIEEPAEEYTWEEEVYATKIYSVKLDGTEPLEFDETIAESDYQNYIYRDISGMYDSGDGNLSVVIRENKEIYDLPEDFDTSMGNVWDYYAGSEGAYIVATYDKDGKSLGEKEIYRFSERDGEANDFRPYYIAFDGEGRTYLSDYNTIAVIDKDGKELKRISGGSFDSIGRVADGKVGVIFWGENEGMGLKVIDPNTLELGEKIAVPADCYEIKAYSDEYTVIFNTSNGIAGVKPDGTRENIINWIDADVDSSNVNSFSVLDNGDVAVLMMEWKKEGGADINLIRFVKTPASEVQQKTVITLATNYLNWDTREAVLEFNKTNPEYRIKVLDYSEYNTSDDYSAGITKLNTEIIAGKVPDIIATSGIPVTRYQSKGILEDLTPYIEKSVGTENLFEPFFNALRTDDGKLYEIYSSFAFQTYYGLKNVVGDGYRWTFADLKETLAKLPEGARVFAPYFTKYEVLNEFVNRNLEGFVDWKSGNCNFEGEEFKEILEFANTFPLEIDWDNYDYSEESDVNTAIKNGKQLINSLYMYDFNEWRANTFYTFGDNVGFVGIPTMEGSGSNFMTSGEGFAMSSTSKYKDAVWEFIGRILTEEYQTKGTDFEAGRIYNFEFPTNKNAFEKFAKAAMTPDFDEFYDPENNMNGGRVYYGMDGKKYAEKAAVEDDVVSETEDLKPAAVVYGEGKVNEKGWHEMPKTYVWGQSETIPVYAMTEYEYGILLDMFGDCDRIYRYDDELIGIINEEVQGYFQGQKNLDDTVKMIQSRVKLYVNEQK